MNKRIFFVFVMCFLSYSHLFSQTFSLVKVVDCQNVSVIIDSLNNVKAKVVFIEDNPILMYNIGVPASDIKIKVGTVSNLVGFSAKNYSYIFKSNSFDLPYLKIRYNGASYWVHGAFPYVFDDNHPDVSFTLQGVDYNIYSARNLMYLSDEYYTGIAVLVVKNVQTNEYKLLLNSELPNSLQGHSYGCKYAYLQADEGVNEQIDSVIVEKHLANLQITAKYQEGGANYVLSFAIPEINPKINYWGIRLND